MEKKYSVVIKKGEDLSLLDKELADSTGNGVIPNRAVKLGEDFSASNRVSEWLLTEDEAEELKKDSRVLNVEDLSDFKYVKLGSGSIPCKMKRGVDANSLRDEERASYYANDPVPQVNWGLGRHQQFTDDHMEVVEHVDNDGTPNTLDALKYIGEYGDTFDYDYDGEGVDIVILDSGVDKNHPEWRDADGNSRFKPIDWQVETGYKVLIDDGTDSPDQYHQPDDFYHDYDGHGTSCASLAAGYYNGFAKGADIYAIKMLDLSQPSRLPEGTTAQDYYSGYTFEQSIQMIKLWHEQKTNNRPTIVNMSFGASLQVYPPNYINHRGSGVFRLMENGEDMRHSSRYIAETTGVKGLKAYSGTVYQPSNHSGDTSLGDDTWEFSRLVVGIQSDAQQALVDELIDAGVHVCIAAGNHGFKLDVNKDAYNHRSNLLDLEGVGEDYDNFMHAVPLNSDTTYQLYHNRPPAPYHPDAFLVGALDSTKVCDVAELTGEYTTVGQTDDNKGGRFFAGTANGPRNMNHSNEIKPEFSAHGPAVNTYAAGVATKAAHPMSYFWTGKSENLAWTDWWRYTYLYDTSSKENKGLSIDVDTSGSNQVRFYISLAQDAVDELRFGSSQFIEDAEELHSLRTTLHYDTSDASLKELIDNAVLGDSINAMQMVDEYIVCYDLSPDSNEVTTNTQTLINPYQATVGEYTPIASLTETRHHHGALYLYVDYNQRKEYVNAGGITIRPRTTTPLDLSTVGEKIIFEVGFKKSEYPEYDDVAKTWNGKPIEDLFTIGSAVFNHLDAYDVQNYYDLAEVNHKGIPLYRGYGYEFVSGTSMASPTVAGLLAVNIEKEGNKTPKEYIDFMSSPYSGHSEKNQHFLDSSKTHRTSPNELSYVGFSRENLANIYDPEFNSTASYNVDDWHSFYTARDLDNKTVDYTGEVPHNNMIIGPKVVAATAGLFRDFEFKITGDVTFYSGAYSRRTNIDLFPPENNNLTYVNGISKSQDPWTSQMTIDGNYYSGMEYPIRQDAEWIPKEFEADSPSITFDSVSSLGNGQFSSTFVNNGTNDYIVPTPVNIGASLLGQSTHDTKTLEMLPNPPSFAVDYSSVTFAEQNPDNTQAELLNPIVNSLGSYTLAIRQGVLDADYFVVIGNIIRTKGSNPKVDFDDPDMPNPLQFKMFAVDAYGQESEEVTVNVTVTNTPDEAPVVTFGGINRLIKFNEWVEIREGSGYQDIISYTLNDNDSANEFLTHRLEVKVGADAWENSDDHDLTQYGIVFDPVAKIISVENFDYENMPNGLYITNQNDVFGDDFKEIELKITAQDAEGNSGESEISVYVENVTEHDPAFRDDLEDVNYIGGTDNISFTKTIPEDTEIGTVLFTIPDAFYSQSSGDEHAYADVSNTINWSATQNSSSLGVNADGEVYITNPLDFEAGETYHLWIKVTNNFYRYSYVRMNITVTDVFDSPVQFVDDAGDIVTTVAADIVEHSEGGTIVYEFRVDSPATVSYDIEMINGSLGQVPSGGTHLRVEDINGNLATSPLTHGFLVTDNEWFPDFESSSSFYIRLKAENVFGVRYLDITPNIIDDPIKDDFKVVDFSNSGEEYVFEVADGTVSGTELFTIDFNKTTKIIGGNLFLTMSAGVADGYIYGDTANNIQGIDIDRVTGVVTLNQDVSYYGLREAYAFYVLASDVETNTTIITLIKIRVINPIPIFDPKVLVTADDTDFTWGGVNNFTTLSESAPIGTELMTVNFVNAAQSNAPLDPSISSGYTVQVSSDPAQNIEVVGGGGSYVIKTTKALDYEASQNINFTLSYQGPDGNAITVADESVIEGNQFWVLLVNEDEAAPVWQNTVASFEVPLDTAVDTTIVTFNVDDDGSVTGDVSSYPITYSLIYATAGFVNYFTFDGDAGQIKAKTGLVGDLNFTITVKATDAAGNFSTKTFIFTTPTPLQRYNLLSGWKNFETVKVQGTGNNHFDMPATWRVAEVHFDNGSAINGRVIIRGKTTATPFYENDIAVAGWQVLDEAGNLVLNFNSLGDAIKASSPDVTSYYSGTTPTEAAQIFSNYQATYLSEVAQGANQTKSRWFLGNSTGSSKTGPQSGYQIGTTEVIDPDTVYNQQTDVPYFFVETSYSALGRCFFLCEKGYTNFALPQKGSIRVMYFNSGSSTIDENDTLAVGIGY